MSLAAVNMGNILALITDTTGASVVQGLINPGILFLVSVWHSRCDSPVIERK
jgi:hypothetical protein